ncbi:MAG: hypothetical protein NTV63_04100 [Candidatus Woesearchaeota archaeon]|nr:hypothetical protein [Candidatus Woesearchaeota archaeon]
MKSKISKSLLFIFMFAAVLLLSAGFASSACDPLVDPDCGDDPIEPPCIGCYPTPTPTPTPTPIVLCGNGVINTGEQCEMPGTSNNNYCVQSMHQCSGNKYGSRDMYGNCNSACGCSNDAFTYSCSFGNCGSECDAAHSCASTDCDYLDGCQGNYYYDYHDVSNSCTGDCGCTENSCTAYTATVNDPRCVECNVDSDCDSRDKTYCSGDSVVSVEGKCVSHKCTDSSPSIVENCNSLDRDYCEGTSIKNDDGYCSFGECKVTKTNVLNCNDGLFCNGVESCSAGNCVSGSSVDCSANDIFGISSCNNVPDGNSLTWDYRASFDSTCNEASDSCTAGIYSISHSCSVNSCGAECDAAHGCSATDCDWKDGCVGKDYYDYSDVSNSCLGGCSCTDNVCAAPVISYNDARCGECVSDSQCDYLDSDFCSGDSVFHVEGKCINYDCVSGTAALVQNCNSLDRNFCEGTSIKNDDGYCASGACYVSTSTVMNCNDGLFCNGVESCSAGNCVSGSSVDCSSNDIFGISSCNNVPDGNSLTWDYRVSFDSTCNEASDSCTAGIYSISHSCSVNSCGAECDVVHGCADTYCDWKDGCVGKDYYDYSGVENSCLSGCACENNVCRAPTIYYDDERCSDHCLNDNDCNYLDSDFCSSDSVMHIDGMCISGICSSSTPSLVGDCTLLDRNFCEGSIVKEDTGYCANAECRITTSILMNCNDGLFCNGVESCSAGNCVAGSSVDCSGNDVFGVSSCNNVPDGNSLTWDYRASFDSTCNEATDSCTAGSSAISHSCSVDSCGAECSNGQVEVRSCTYGGIQSRSCTDSCIWGIWSNCENEGVCTPGTKESRECGYCGTSERVCLENYQWGLWGSCSGAGVCVSGLVDYEMCGKGGSRFRTCDDSCYWGAFSNCTDEKECYPGTIEEEKCLIFGVRKRICQSNYYWGSWSSCTFPRGDIAINQLQIINEDCIQPGEDLTALVDFSMLGYHEQEVKITAVIPDLSLRSRIGPIDVEADGEISRVLLLTLPEDTPEGVYDVRFTINDDIRRVKHRSIIVKKTCCRSCSCSSC